MELDAEALKTLRDAGVRAARFDDAGKLRSVSFFPQPFEPPMGATEQAPESPAMSAAREAATRLMRGPKPEEAKS